MTTTSEDPTREAAHRMADRLFVCATEAEEEGQHDWYDAFGHLGRWCFAYSMGDARGMGKAEEGLARLRERT